MQTTSWTKVVAAGVLLLGCGCSAPFGVRLASPQEVHRSLTGSVLSTGELSTFTQIALRRQNMIERFDDDPAGALRELHDRLRRGLLPPDDLFALTELSFFHAEKKAAKDHFLAAAVYAFAYLFPSDEKLAPDAFDPRLRIATDLYNRALTEGLSTPQGEHLGFDAGTYALPFGLIDVSFDEHQLEWGSRRLIDFIAVADYEVQGLRNRYREPGLGAPLAAKTEAIDPNDPLRYFVGPHVRVPVTAVLRIARPREQLLGEQLYARLELYTATDHDSIRIGARTVALEYEPTAALATALAESRPWESELTSFLGQLLPPLQRSQAALGAREPHRRGRIPVVFVHGTASSVARWADMVNDLDSDPFLRRNFEFWFFRYDSGNPIAYSAMLLRRALKETVAGFQTGEADPCLEQMVVIGHSQGGLLTKMTAIESGDRFWQDLSSKPLADSGYSEKTRALLQEALFVDPLPFVHRVVFVATPHRGSYLAGPQLIQRLAGKLISMPGSLAAASTEIVAGIGSQGSIGLERLPTSIDNMSPGNRFIQAIASIPVSPGVKAHTICGVTCEGEPDGCSDGVVKYSSAHIDGVESELLVRHGHSMQSHPEVVNEVQRILHLHAAENRCAPQP